MNKGSRIAGEYHTLKRYPLYLVGARYSPWLVMSEGQGFQVSGQLYLVDEEAMKWMDTLERTNKADGYHKVTIDIAHDQTKDVCAVQTYGKWPGQLSAADIQLGPLRSYECEHAALYQRRNASQPRRNNPPHKTKRTGQEI